ncbi:uncharacterized protein METZ01_LOCUS123353, partial [marine metagenome]
VAREDESLVGQCHQLVADGRHQLRAITADEISAPDRVAEQHVAANEYWSRLVTGGRVEAE